MLACVGRGGHHAHRSRRIRRRYDLYRDLSTLEGYLNRHCAALDRLLCFEIRGRSAIHLRYDLPMQLADVRTVVVPRELLTETRGVLRKFGQHGCEGLALWAGSIEKTEASILRLIVPEQNPIKNETGVGYFVEGPTLFKLSKYLEKEKLRLIAQVHSHPTEAYHSEADDRYAIVTEEGGFSLVVPDFARAEMTLPSCAIYRLTNGEWLELGSKHVAATFQVG